MEELFLLLKKDILQVIQQFEVILDDKYLQKTGCKNRLISTKQYLEDSYTILEDLIYLISTDKIDSFSLISVIARLKEVEIVAGHEELSSKLNATHMYLDSLKNQLN